MSLIYVTEFESITQFNVHAKRSPSYLTFWYKILGAYVLNFWHKFIFKLCIRAGYHVNDITNVLFESNGNRLAWNTMAIISRYRFEFSLSCGLANQMWSSLNEVGDRRCRYTLNRSHCSLGGTPLISYKAERFASTEIKLIHSFPRMTHEYRAFATYVYDKGVHVGKMMQ